MSDVVHTITLTDPVQNGSETVTELRFQRLRARHMGELRLEEMQLKHFFPMVSKLTGQPMHVIEELSPTDIIAVVNYVGESLPLGLATGTAQSASSQ